LIELEEEDSQTDEGLFECLYCDFKNPLAIGDGNVDESQALEWDNHFYDVIYKGKKYQRCIKRLD
jgi:hypothetical protein